MERTLPGARKRFCLPLAHVELQICHFTRLLARPVADVILMQRAARGAHGASQVRWLTAEPKFAKFDHVVDCPMLHFTQLHT